MKTLLLIASFLFIPCQDIQKQAESAVVKYIKSNADDVTGFEVVNFGKAEKFMLPFSSTNIGKLYFRLAEIPLAEAKDMHEKIESGDAINSKSNQDYVEENMARAKRYLNRYDSAEAKYKPINYGWKIFAKYRLKNRVGLIKLNEDTFYLDKKLKVVDRDTITVFIN